MTKHTRGPWHAGGNVYTHSRYAVMNEASVLIAEVVDFFDESETIANAQLIAAAPELLRCAELDVKAFEQIATIVQQIRASDTNPKNALDIIFDLASMPAAPLAIAKVRGAV